MLDSKRVSVRIHIDATHIDGIHILYILTLCILMI